MPYAHTTFLQFRQQLAARLQDPTNVFWTDAELGQYIIEALRTWNVMAAWYRDRMSFNTTALTSFYDLGTVPGSLIPRTVTDQSQFQLIEYHLLEPITAGTWAGSEQFDAADLTAALQKRRDQFLLETGSVLTHSTQVTGITSNGRINIDDSIIDVRRLAYFDVNGVYTNLWRVDEAEANAWTPGWSINPGAPSGYSVVATPPVQIQIIPVMNIAGTLDLLTINAGATLDPTIGIPLGVPDDFAWVVKFGALVDLLTKDGPPSDSVRAQYCQRRWEEGIELAKWTTSVLLAQLDGIQVYNVVSMFDLDTNNRTWQNGLSGQPTIAAMAGLNMLILADPPDSNPHSVLLDVLRNFPVPVVDSDPILVGREDLDPILDYSEHLAALKMSGAEFAATIPAYERLVRLAMLQNERWRAFSKFPGDLHNRTRRDFSQVRRQAHPEPIPVSADMEGGI